MAFSIQNRFVGDFAVWASTPGVEVVLGNFDESGGTDFALVNHNPGWTTIPLASSGPTSFTINNAFVGTFGQWAAGPNVEVLVGDFYYVIDSTPSDIALVNKDPGWATVPVAQTGFLFGYPGVFADIHNAYAPDFAAWAATPGVQVIAGAFDQTGGGNDIALINREPGWNTIPVARAGILGGDVTFTIENRPVGDFALWANNPGAEVLTGDFDGNGQTDIALINHEPGWNTVPVALSDTTGFFIQNRVVDDFASWAATPGVEVLTGDFDGDNRTDIALVNHSAGWNTVPVALAVDGGFAIENRPMGDFALWAASPNIEVVTGDFNDDERTDIALVNRAAGWTTVPVALANDAGGFTVENADVGDFAIWATNPDAEVFVADFNGDFKQDLALVNRSPGWDTVPVALSEDWLI